MKILAIDTSAKVTSVAVCDGEQILLEFNINTNLTHSQALMPMIEAGLRLSALSINEIDCFATTVGPGSFTGLRIGIGAIKGLAYALEKEVIPISTLEALAFNLINTDGYVVAAMDARCSQVYTARFLVDNKTMTRLSDDEAISIEELKKSIADIKGNVYCVGDGATLCKASIDRLILPVALAEQRAVSVAILAGRKGIGISANDVVPRYIRLPQAMRDKNNAK